MSGQLRRHLRERHGVVKVPRATAAAERLHGIRHHQYTPNHRHAGPNSGPGDRPPGWKTGGDVVELDGTPADG